MTNEELVIEIKNGKTEYLPTLWEQVERFVACKANKVVNALEDNCIEFDDLYNSAYLYLQKAVDYFDPNVGVTFLTVYGYFIMTAFTETTGRRTSKTRNDPLRHALSLDTPVKEGEEATYGDMIADDIDIEEQVTQRMWEQDLHNALEEVLSELPLIEEEVIRLKYYGNLSPKQIGEIKGFSDSRVGQIERKGLRNLRTPKNFRRLEQYIDLRTNFYLRTSVESQLSPVELLVERREEMRERFSDKRSELLKRIEQQ